MRIGGHHLLATPLVVIRLTPTISFQKFGDEIPIHVMILVVVGTKLLCEYRGVGTTIGVRRELLTLLRIEVGFEGNGRAYDIRVQFQQTTDDTIHLIRF